MSKTIEKLNLYLTNLNVLYRKVQNYHWNVTGVGFFSIHSKLEDYYDDINKQIDDVAERILAIGGRPIGTLKGYLETTTLTEAKDEEIAGNVAILEVKKDFELMLALAKEVKVVADEENDYGSSALVDEYIQSYEKNIWMLNAFLK